jgi:ferrochelatase
MEASSNANPLKTCIVGKLTPGWSEAQPLVSKQSFNRHLLPVEALVTSTTKDVSDTPLIGDDKIGVLLLNLGGPETLDDVQPFLFNLFADPVILFSSFSTI